MINQMAGKEVQAPIVQSGPSISTKEMNDIREAMKKIAEHTDKIAKLEKDMKGINIEQIMKRLNQLAEELKSKADKGDIFRLENEKAEKITVEGEFERVWREIEGLKKWLSKVDETVSELKKMPQGSVSQDSIM